ncbi:uncharacterized protein METZ01_LOCUS336930, partial [marine metagenome]
AHTLGCAAGAAVQRVIEREGLITRVAEEGKWLLETLQAELGQNPHVGDVRGRGLFAGIELVTDKHTKQPLDEALMGAVVTDIAGRGVLVGKTTRSIPGFNNTINIAPPLIVTQTDIDEIVEAVAAGIHQVTAKGVR